MISMSSLLPLQQPRPRGVRLEACGEGASRALRAAAHRFRNFYLDLRTAGIDDTACQPASVARAVPVSQRFGQGPFSIYDEAVDRWWSTVEHALIPLRVPSDAQETAHRRIYVNMFTRSSFLQRKSDL